MVFNCVDGINLSSQMETGTLLALCSGTIDKTPLVGLAVFGQFDFSENLITAEKLIKSIEICIRHQARFLLLPITLTGELPKVPTDLLDKVSMIFYSTLDDMIIKALGISSN